MKFFINNNTTYNYSYYATRPKWLVEALLKESLSQKEFKANSLCLKKSLLNYKIAFDSCSSYLKDQRFFDFQEPKGCFASSKKTKGFLRTETRQKSKSQEDKAKGQFLTQSGLKTKGFWAVFALQAQTKNQTITSQKLKGKAPAAGSKTKIIEANPKKIYQHLFQAKELLCWTSDLSFFNLRGYFSNILKVLQICRFAVRNNKKILFIKRSSPNYGQGKLLNPWLVQYERNIVPITLSNLFNKSYLNPTQRLLSPQILRLKKNKGKYQDQNHSHKSTNVVKHPLSQQEESRRGPASHSLSKEDCLKTNQLGGHSNRIKEENTPEDKQNNPPRRYYQLSGLLNSCLNLNFGNYCNYKASHFKNPFVFTPYSKDQKTPSNPWKPTFKQPFPKTENGQKKTLLLLDPYLKDQNNVFQGQNLKNNSKYSLPPNKITNRIDNIIKLWIKEAQTMSQQTAAGLTIPLAGFLTNSKITFNTVYNLSNDDFYSSINSNLKSNSLFNRSVCKIKTSRLEKVNSQKIRHLFSESSVFGLEARSCKSTEVGSKDGLKTEPSVKNLRYGINQKQMGRKQIDNPGALAKNFPKDSNVDIVFTPKDQRAQGFDQRGWWIDYSNSHNYLPLTPQISGVRGNFFFKESESIIHNEKTKRSKSLEYCYFGDAFTWQSKCQKQSSMFYFNSPFSKNKDNIITYLKKQVVLEKRGPIFFKKKNHPSLYILKNSYKDLKI